MLGEAGSHFLGKLLEVSSHPILLYLLISLFLYNFICDFLSLYLEKEGLL